MVNEEIAKEEAVKKSSLWQVFRVEVGNTYLPTKIIERIKLRIKEKIDEKNKNC